MTVDRLPAHQAVAPAPPPPFDSVSSAPLARWAALPGGAPSLRGPPRNGELRRLEQQQQEGRGSGYASLASALLGEDTHSATPFTQGAAAAASAAAAAALAPPQGVGLQQPPQRCCSSEVAPGLNAGGGATVSAAPVHAGDAHKYSPARCALRPLAVG